MEIEQSIHQKHQLVMSAAMEQAFHVLAMPTLELAAWLEEEIEKNPLLTLVRPPSEPFDTTSLSSQPTLYEYLAYEIELHFQTKREKEIAREIAGSLNRDGFLTLMPHELQGKEEVLDKFQRMNGLGLGARTVREALLLQLSEKKGELIYQVVDQYYNDLLRKQIDKIAKKLKINTAQLKQALKKDLLPLTPFPGRAFENPVNPKLFSDISLLKGEEGWRIEVHDTDLPTFEINTEQIHRVESSARAEGGVDFIHRYLAAGKWLQKIVHKRKKTLLQIGTFLIKNQQRYLEGIQANPSPLTMKEMAENLSLNESTITRAIANKGIATPRGLLQLRSFFTYPLQNKTRKVSNRDAKNLLWQLISREETPLSDKDLAQELKRRGMPCARRTVAKYRKELKILPAYQRKGWKL